MGPAYLRYSFTRATEQEVDFLIDALDLTPGDSVLDVGCGPGRHSNEMARRGFAATGVDISQAFIDVAAVAGEPGAQFQRGDARQLAFDRQFDAVISLCQGAFGLQGPAAGVDSDPQRLVPDLDVLGGIHRALRPGGRFAITAFSAYFQVKWLEDGDRFEAASGLNHERTEVMNADGDAVAADLWTTCYTPRELRLMAERVGLVVDAIYSVSPGEYARRSPDLAHHEFLVMGHRKP